MESVEHFFCTDRIILVEDKGKEEVGPWAWFQEKSREDREQAKAWCQ